MKKKKKRQTWTKAKTNAIIKDIKALKIQGARNVALAGLKVLHNEYLKDKSTANINDVLNKLHKTRPTEPMLRNSLKYYLYLIKKQDKSMTLELEDYPIAQPSSLYDMIEIAKYITDSHKEDPEMVCITCIADMARDKNLYVDFLDFTDPTTTLVTISNNETSAPFVFEFLNKYAVG